MTNLRGIAKNLKTEDSPLLVKLFTGRRLRRNYFLVSFFQVPESDAKDYCYDSDKKKLKEHQII